MAVDEALFQCYLDRLSPPTLRFYGWDPPTVIRVFPSGSLLLHLEGLTSLELEWVDRLINQKYANEVWNRTRGNSRRKGLKLEG